MTSFIRQAHIESSRLSIQTVEGSKFNIALKKSNSLNCLEQLFWKKLRWNNNDYILNLRSLSKRLGVSYFTALKVLPNLSNCLGETVAVFSKIKKVQQVLFAGVKEAASLIKSIEFKRKEWNPQDPSVRWEQGKGHFVITLKPKDSDNPHFYIGIAKILGTGGYRTFYPLINYQNGSPLALGVQHKVEPYQVNRGINEYRLLKMLRGIAQVVQSLFFIENGIERTLDGKVIKIENGRFFLATEKCDGTLRDFLRANLKKKLSLFIEILKGVINIHERGIVHRDLKMSNIMYKRFKQSHLIKIIDFGFACLKSNQEALKKDCGTLQYKAPEVFLKEEKKFPEKLDSWSLGIILYVLCERKFPPYVKQLDAQKDPKQNMQIVLDGVQEIPFKRLKKGNPIIEVIKGLLDPDPKTRLSGKNALENIESFF